MLIMKLPNTVCVKCCSSFTSAANISLVLSHLKLKVENMPKKKKKKPPPPQKTGMQTQ